MASAAVRAGGLLEETRRVDLGAVDPARLLDLLRRHDLRGHGGAGFPTATKISAVLGSRPDLVVNACDGEPLVAKDATLLARTPHLVADGVALVARLVDARAVRVAVHRGSAAEPLAHRLVADPATPRGTQVLDVPARYVSSEASALTAYAHGGPARPFDHPEPLTSGSRAHRPTLVLNAETVARVAALHLDPYRAPTRLVSVATLQRGLVEVRELGLGTTVREAVGAASAGTTPSAYLVGGYAGRWLPARAGDATLADLGRDLGAGLVLAHGPGCPLGSVARILDWLAAQSAGQCGPCVFGLPAVAADWHRLADPRGGDEAEARLRRRLPLLAGRGACRHPDGTAAMVGSALAVFGEHVSRHRSDAGCDPRWSDRDAA